MYSIMAAISRTHALINIPYTTQCYSTPTTNCAPDNSIVLPPTAGNLSLDLTSESNFDQYVFGVTGEGCGYVSMNVSGDTTSVTCSGWTAAGQTCSFEVRTLSQDCGFTESLTGKCS